MPRRTDPHRERDRPPLLFSMIFLAASTLGCGAGATAIGVGVVLGTSGSGGGGRSTHIDSALFVDLNDDGLIDAGDLVTVTFNRDISLDGTPLADTVFALDPPGSFGGTAIVAPGPTSRQVIVLIQDLAVLQANGDHGTDPGSSGTDLAPGQIGILTPGGKPIGPAARPVDLGGEIGPRVASAHLIDMDGRCTVNSGDWLEVTFTANVTVNTALPSDAFQLPVGGDTLGVGLDSTFQGPTTDVRAVTIVLGTAPVLTDLGEFEAANLAAGSPSGLEVNAAQGAISAAAYPWIDAVPYRPGGIDIGSRPGAEEALRGDDLADGLHGQSVAFAGNVDSNSNPEVLIGAPGLNGSTGKAFLYTRAQSPGGRPSKTWESTGDDRMGAIFGASVASAGEVSNDSFLDIIVGAPGYPVGSFGSGKAYVYLGQVGSGASLVPFWTSVGDDASGAEFGRSVASAGNINGDLYGDIIVGAPGRGLLPSPLPGKVFVYLSGPAGLAATADWTSEGDVGQDDRFGASVASAGDVDGDGFDDIIVGAPMFDTAGAVGAGRAYLFLGSSAGLSAAPDWESSGDDTPDANFGHSVASAGDVNRDGYSDVIVGAPGFDTLGSAGAGKAYLFLGGPLELSPTAAWTSSGGDIPGVGFGSSVASAGDVNGDGFDDLIVGAPGAGAIGNGSGTVYLFSSGPFGPTFYQSWSAAGIEQAGDGFGWSVATAGKFLDSDGKAEVVVGIPGFDTSNPDAGTAYLFRICSP